MQTTKKGVLFMKSNEYMLGFAVAVIFGFLAVLILAIVKRRKGVKEEYDERQELVRGKAYKAALFTLMIYLCVDMMVGFIWRAWAMPGVSSALGVFLAVGVFVAVCIRNDALLALRQNPKKAIMMALLVIACQLPSLLFNSDPLVENGLLTHKAISLGCIALFGFEAIMLLLRMRREKEGDDA